MFEKYDDNGHMFGFTSNYIKVKLPFNPLIVNDTAFVKMTAINNDGTMNVTFSEKHEFTQSIIEIN